MPANDNKTGFSSISGRLILYIVLCSSVLTLLLTIFQLYRGYQVDLATIENDLNQIERVHIDTITESLWALDTEKLKTIVRGLSNLRDISYVAILENGVVLVSQGEKPATDARSRSFPLAFESRGNTQEIGQLNVVLDIAAVNRRLLDRMFIILASNALKTTLVVIFIVLIFYRIVTRHLTHISQYLVGLEIGGPNMPLKLDRQQTSPVRNDELDLVVGSINQHLDETHNHMVERKKSEEKLIKGNEEYDRLNKELDQRVKIRTRDLENAVQELEAFTYSVSHDLRSPLRSLGGFSQAILEDYSDKLDDSGKNYLERIRLAAVRMGELIDDLLKLSRISKRDLKIKPVNLSEIAISIRTSLLQGQESRKIELSVEDGLKVHGDPGLLRIVLENLLGNAVKYTTTRNISKIQFGQVESDERGKAFYIRDNGVGFDMTYVDKLFQTFQRLHHAREFPGNGIGLSIVERIIKKHSGSIWAESIVDEGTTFYFKL